MAPYAEEIKKQDVIDQLTWDDSVDANEILVKVADRTVVLNGTVENSTAKMAAERDAYQVRGVMRVENNLEIRFPPSVTMPSDSEIEENIRRMLEWNSEIQAGKIDIASRNNTVTLSGTAESFWEKYLAGNIANATNGVLEVINEISVDPSGPVNDTGIENDIKNAYRRTYLIDEDKIRVEVRNGVVHLKGTVSNYPVRIQAHNIATYTSGVTDVVDDLTIE